MCLDFEENHDVCKMRADTWITAEVMDHHQTPSPALLLRGVNVAPPLLLQYYQLLPQCHADEDPADWKERFRKGMARFRRSIEARYNEATLERLLFAPDAEVRQAAVLALGFIGTMNINGALAASLHDDDPMVRHLTADALWTLWFRADTPENNRELQRLLRLNKTADEVLAGLAQLIESAPRFAEAFNQRAIFLFRRGEHAGAAADCERVLKLNPYHFGAASGLGQCYLRQKKPRAALRAFRRALRLNPNLESVRETIESLERMLGEEGKR